MQAQIRFRKLKEGFEEHIQELRDELKVVSEELREELQLLHVQTNNRLFFGTSHSVSRYATKLTSYRPPWHSQSGISPPLNIVAGGWSGENRDGGGNVIHSSGRLTWSEKWSIQTPEEFFGEEELAELSSDDSDGFMPQKLCKRLKCGLGYFTLTDKKKVVNVKEVKSTC